MRKNRNGGVKELWTISFPLMIVTFSSVFLMFVDRLFLANYSTEALNACVTSSTMGWVFVYMGMHIASKAEVFVAHCFGAERFSDIGRPVWQMIWFSLFSSLFYIPFGIFGGEWIYQNSPYAEMEKTYFSWLVCFGPVFSLSGALAAFYVGMGRTRLVTALSLVANVINVVLDYFLIFGIEGLFAAQGVRGAVIATCIGQVIQTTALAVLVLRKSNWSSFGISSWKIDISIFKNCLRVGAPLALFYGMELLGWAAFYEMMTGLSEVHITVSGICQSIYFLVCFFPDGLSKGASIIVGNCLGARQPNTVRRVLLSGEGILLLFFLALGVLLVAYPEPIFMLFVQDMDTFPLSSLRVGLVCLWLYTFFEGARWLLSGILTAAGDTLFLLLTGSVSVWLGFVLPIYYFIVRENRSVEEAWGIVVVYSVVLFLFYLLRFYQGKWRNANLIGT